MRLMIFTDLDGTLLDHRDYSFAAAAPALEKLHSVGVPLILASSKTAAEIAPLAQALGTMSWPAVVENGASIARPGAPIMGTDDYERIRGILAALPEDVRAPFRGFGDMSVDEIAAQTGLSIDEAQRAKQRQSTEPGLYDGSDEQQSRFLAALGEHGVSARRGGRFLTLSFGASKADRMNELINEYRPEATLALGDAANDVEMIEAADYGVIVRNDHGPGIPPLAGEQDGRIRRTELSGPSGWNEAVLSKLCEMEPCGDDA